MKYYKNEPRFNGVYSRNNLSKRKDGAYIISLDKYSDIGSHWVALSKIEILRPIFSGYKHMIQ